MFKPNANYFSLLRIENAVVAKQFAGLDFVDNIQIQYPAHPNEEIVTAAYTEVLNHISGFPGVTTERFANSIHYGFDDEAEEMEPNIIEKHSIFFHDKPAGTLVLCADGEIYETLSTIQ